MWYGYGTAQAAQQPQGWLTHERIKYLRDLLELTLLLLGLPWLVYHFARDPAGFLRSLGKSREG